MLFGCTNIHRSIVLGVEKVSNVDRCWIDLDAVLGMHLHALDSQKLASANKLVKGSSSR